MTVYGYARVSAKDQNLDRQLIALDEFGVDAIYADKASGADFDRPEYRKMVRRLREGDVLAVGSIDRFGRSYDEVLEEWRRITRDKGCAVVVLDMPLLDTREERGATGRLISDIVLQLLSYVAQTEREYIKKRQAEGIAAAKARGVKFGRPRKERPAGFEDVQAMYRRGEISHHEAAKMLGANVKTYDRWCEEAAR